MTAYFPYRTDPMGFPAAPHLHWGRHLEGWQLGVVAVGIALTAVYLTLPRPIPPEQPPLPMPDREEERRASRLDRERTQQARSTPLPYVIRSLGEALRRYGAASFKDDRDRAEQALGELQRTVAGLPKQEFTEPLLALRSIQTELFLMALSQWEFTGQVNADLQELGGDFHIHAVANGWWQGGHLELTPGECRILYRVRWTRLLALLESPPFAPSQNDWRLYYRTLLLHPERRGGDSAFRADPTHPASESGLAQVQLTYVAGLVRRDASYPESLARGILEQKSGRPDRSLDALNRFLMEHPTGPHHLRALNHRVSALHQLRATQTMETESL